MKMSKNLALTYLYITVEELVHIIVSGACVRFYWLHSEITDHLIY